MDALLAELRALSGRDDEASNFFLEHDGFRITVACTRSSLVLQTRYDAVAAPVVLSGYRDAPRGIRAKRPMNIALRTNTSPIPSALEAVRRGATDLFALGFESIVIDDEDGHVKATLPTSGRAKAEAILSAFVSVLRCLPPILA